MGARIFHDREKFAIFAEKYAKKSRKEPRIFRSP